MVYEPAGGKEREGGRMAGRELVGREGGWQAGREAVPSRTCATLGTIRGGTASAVGSSEARRFWRAAAYRQFVQEKAPWCSNRLNNWDNRTEVRWDRVSGRGGASARFS